MAFPITTGTVSKGKTREETPEPGDLYFMEVPLLVDGVQTGILRAEFFMRDNLPANHPPITDRDRAIRFIQENPKVRWDF